MLGDKSTETLAPALGIVGEHRDEDWKSLHRGTGALRRVAPLGKKVRMARSRATDLYDRDRSMLDMVELSMAGGPMSCRRSILAASATFLLCSAPLFAHATSFNVLHDFSGGNDGSGPAGSLVEDSAGNLYGTTGGGGGTGCHGVGCGTVFRIAPDGTETIVHAFQGGADGAGPMAGLIIDSSGNLYGATMFGGNPNCLYNDKHQGCGAVFKITPDGAETILYAFAGGKDGSEPHASLAMDQAGDLFGTTTVGGGAGKTGSKRCRQTAGCGTVFEISANGTETVLHAFRGGKDGYSPYGNVVLDSSGNLFGATEAGGRYGCGAIYEIPRGGSETVLYRFKCGADGEGPGGLALDRAGDLFGATQTGGGGTCGCGTIFKITPRGHKKILYAFQGGSDGEEPPYAPPVLDADGNLYGATLFGGGDSCSPDGCGVVFKLGKNNEETVLHAFNESEGSYPWGGVIVDGAGDVFGAAYSGADDCDGNDQGCGLVFELANGTRK